MHHVLSFVRLADHLRDTYDGTPPDDDPSPAGKGDENEASEYPEPEIDEMRAQRDTVLKRYIQVRVKNSIFT